MKKKTYKKGAFMDNTSVFYKNYYFLLNIFFLLKIFISNKII